MPLDLTAVEQTELEALSGKRVRLLAGFSSSSAPGVCEQALWSTPPLRALRGPVSLRNDVNQGGATTVMHFYVPPGSSTLEVYGLEGACLVTPTNDTIAIGNIADGSCRFDPGVPCQCATDGAPLLDAHHRFVPGTFLREASIPIDPAAWGIWRMYKNASDAVMPMTLRNAPPYFAASAELLPIPKECVTAGGLSSARCGQ